MSSAEIEVEGYARVKNARLRVKKLPVFYWPYMIWPAKTERTSGLLVPERRLLAAARRVPGARLVPGAGTELRQHPLRRRLRRGLLRRGRRVPLPAVGDHPRQRAGLLLPQRGAQRRRLALRLGPCRRRAAVRHARRGRHRALQRLRSLPRLRAQREPEHPAVHLLERFRLRELGRALAEHPRRPARDLSRRQRRRPSRRASCPRSPTACASASSGRAPSTCRSAPPRTTSSRSAPVRTTPGTAASTCSPRSSCRCGRRPGSRSRSRPAAGRPGGATAFRPTRSIPRRRAPAAALRRRGRRLRPGSIAARR